MELSDPTLIKLRNIINSETWRRSGPELVKFFNNFGFDDTYGKGFPSRWQYTDEKLSQINGTPDIEKCIQAVFSPQNFIENYEHLENLISEFNQYLVYDGWKIIRTGKNINFIKTDDLDTIPELDRANDKTFLEKEIEEINFEKLGLDSDITNIISLRIEEIKKCMLAHAPLAVIILSGSVLEGILFGKANQMPKKFNQSKSAPKDSTDNTTKKFRDWSLANFIDVAYELGLLKEDVKKYSHSLRDFRNYVHPNAQLNANFYPNDYTAKISFQVLITAINQLSQIDKA